MSNRNSDSHAFSDLERPHPVIADFVSDGHEPEPLSVRLGDLWSDFLRVADEARDSTAPRKVSALPLLDDMKGILQWD
jgi:hypothetical protein